MTDPLWVTYVFLFRKTDYKNVNIIIQFTANYPNEPVVVELTSKTMSEKLLAGLIKMCDEEAKKLLGEKQVTVRLRHFVLAVVPNTYFTEVFLLVQ